MSYVTPQQQQQPYPTYTPQGQPVYYAQPVYAPQPVMYAQPQPYQQHVQSPYQQQQPQQPVYAAPVRHVAAPTSSTRVLAHNAGVSSGGGPAVDSDGSLSVSSAGGYRDAKWAILFILYMLAYLIPGFVLFNTMTKNADTIKLFSVSMSQTAAKMLAAVVGIAAVMSLFWLLVARHRPRGLIYFALWTSFALTVIMAILCISSAIFGAIILFIIAAFQLIFIVTQRKRIAFAAKILSYSVACVQKWPATILTAFGSILFTFVWYILWLIAAIGLVWSTLKSVQVYQSNGTYATEWQATNTTYVAYIHIVFALYWATQVIKNVLHVTVAGVMASWYFLYPVHAVKNPTAGSLKRALTTSFGSICLGSLLVAILRTIRAILSYARSHQGRGGLAILLCVLQCIFDWFDAILVYFNQYAYAQVAIYGKTYMHSARATWELFKVRGFDALVNDTVIGNALTMAAWLGGLMTAIFSGLVAYYVAKTDAWLMWAIIGLLLGFVMTMITLEVVDSAVICLFVCLAEDPAALQSTKPEIYNDVVSDITNDYPNISFSRA